VPASLLIVAEADAISPAAPMDATHTVEQPGFGPVIECVSSASLPLRWSAGSHLDVLAVDEHVDERRRLTRVTSRRAILL